MNISLGLSAIGALIISLGYVFIMMERPVKPPVRKVPANRAAIGVTLGIVIACFLILAVDYGIEWVSVWGWK